MTTTSWQLSGEYDETCSCDFVCPCLPGQMTVRPTQGSCTFAMAFQIVRGSVLVIAVLFVVANLLADLSYRLLDPRVRAERGAA